MSHDTSKLETKARTFDEKLAKVRKLEEVLIPIFHRPGWTTIAEGALVELALDNLTQHLDVTTQHQQRLIEAAGLVGKGSPAAKL
ncbi:MAG: hypothetical protein P4L91_14550 [Burkholderiaceae bacterium]|nr:hypothetical protein [Burkholderiaceae bacterium]